MGGEILFTVTSPKPSTVCHGNSIISANPRHANGLTRIVVNSQRSSCLLIIEQTPRSIPKTKGARKQQIRPPSKMPLKIKNRLRRIPATPSSNSIQRKPAEEKWELLAKAICAAIVATTTKDRDRPKISSTPIGPSLCDEHGRANTTNAQGMTPIRKTRV